jgi:hypothetical protein
MWQRNEYGKLLRCGCIVNYLLRRLHFGDILMSVLEGLLKHAVKCGIRLNPQYLL